MTADGGRPADAVREITWRAWPLRARPARGVLALILVAGCAWGTWDWTGDPLLAGVAAAFLLVATGSFFVPTRYRLSSGGVEIARPWRRWTRPWSRFRSVSRGRELIVLSTFDRASWLDSFRGEKLFLENSPEGVTEFVEEMVGKETGADAG